MPTRKLYGKYRATVANTIDPQALARLQLVIPAVFGSKAVWAEACIATQGTVSGPPDLPPLGSQVWVEFEAGDTARPIWVGQRVTQPAAPVDAFRRTIDTRTGLVTVSETGDGGLSIQTSGGSLISIGAAGIVLSNGQGASITLTGPAVSINNGALVVV